jgi:hypothetical protein
MADRIKGEDDVTAQARLLVVVTPDDNNDLPNADRCRGLLVCGDGGNISLIMADAVDAVALPGIAGGGTEMALRVRRVRATGTSVAAGSLLAMY